MTFVPGSSIAGILLSNTFCCKICDVTTVAIDLQEFMKLIPVHQLKQRSRAEGGTSPGDFEVCWFLSSTSNESSQEVHWPPLKSCTHETFSQKTRTKVTSDIWRHGITTCNDGQGRLATRSTRDTWKGNVTNRGCHYATVGSHYFLGFCAICTQSLILSLIWAPIWLQWTQGTHFFQPKHCVVKLYNMW